MASYCMIRAVLSRRSGMKKILLLLTPLILASCGGGGGGGGSETPATDTDDGSAILPTAVIDGYVSGANVFVDMNWNLVQDDGEPSATENTTSQTYDFIPPEFAAVNDFTESCAVNRPRIAEVPVGAEDSVRGSVTEAYTMLYFPSALDSYEKVNVTPFTTLFTGFVLDAVGTTTIAVADSCGSDANDIADSVIQEVQEVLAELEQTYGVDPNYFYEDFIQSMDEEKQQIGELIVNFLTTIHEIKGVLEEFYEVQLLSYPSRDLVSTILSGEAFDTAEFNIVTHTIPEQVDEYFEYSKQYNFEHLVADSSGQLLDKNGDPITITLENIRENSAFATYENYFSDPDALVTGRHVSIRISNIKNLEGVTDSRTSIRFSIQDDECSLVLAQYYENEVFERRASNECAQQAYTELRFMNSMNTYFDYDLATIVQNRDVTTINAIFDELYAMPTGINNRDNMTYYLLDRDELVFELYRTFRWYYRLTYHENREDEESCEKFNLDDHTLMQRWTGTEAYPMCYEAMQCTSGHAGSSC